jgi:hypothetical protein
VNHRPNIQTLKASEKNTLIYASLRSLKILKPLIG